MMDDATYNTEEEIEKYLTSKMSDTEKSAFEKRLAEDDDLRAELEAQKEARFFVMLAGREASKAEIKAIWEKLESESPRPFFNPYRRYLIPAVAVVALLLAFSLWYFNRPSAFKNTYEEIASIVDTKTMIPQQMGVGDDVRFAEANQKFRGSHYSEATVLLNELLSDYPQSDTLHYMLGYAWLQEAKAEKAIPHFEEIIQMPEANQVLKQRSEWNLGLAYLLEENSTSAEAQFQKIEQDNRNLYQKNATQALKKLGDLLE